MMDSMMVFWFFMVVSPAICTGGIATAICRHVYHRKMDERYLEGVQDGHNLETKYAVDRAVEEYRQELHRKMVQTGRSTVARPDAPTSRIHRAKVAPARRPRPNSQG